ncbi:hypothetical protein K488DRAFT_12332, partial [Vararia minispora EC-137]
PPTLSRTLFDELSACVRGDAYLRGDPQFPAHTRLFNGNVLCESQAVVLPLDAQEVSKVVLFCRKHGLSPSVKAGGFGTHGSAINGQIIIDLSRLTDIDIEAPLPNTDGLGYTPLSEMVPSHAKGKGKAAPPAPTAIKRARDDANVDTAVVLARPGAGASYDAASPAVASFLRGSPLPPDGTGEALREPPAHRRKLDVGIVATDGVERQVSSGSDVSRSTDASVHMTSSAPTSVTSKSPTPLPDASERPSVPVLQPQSATLAHDPFGYLADDGPRPMRLLSSTTASPPPLATDTDIWGPAAAAIFSHPLFNPTAHLARAAADMVPVHRQAFVTFGAGAKQKDVDRFTADNPLEAVSLTGDRGGVPYHVPFSAHPVGSSVMLLGGFGFLSRLYGLSIDNLVEVEVVLADGSIVIANERDHPDLWWAMRGAGPALGIATRYKARAFPVPVVFAGNLIYRFRRATAPSLIKHFRDCVKGAPRELYANLILTAGPSNKDSIVVIQMCFVGSRERGQEFLQAISSWDGEVMLKDVDEKRFLNQQDSVAQVLRGRPGNQWFIRSALASSLPDEVINRTVLEFADTPIGCTWLFELAGGAIADVEQSCVPKTQREAAFTIAALHQWEMGIDDPRCVETAEEWLDGTIGSVALGGPFPSFLGRHEDPRRVMTSYGENWGRLVALKKKYDPEGFFRHSFWPLDPDGNVVESSVHEPRTP